MAHLINVYDNGEYYFAENGKKRRAWHNLGQVFDGEMDVKTALAASHADFTVGTIPAGYMTAEGWIADDKHRYTQRQDNGEVLGLVTDSYGVVQNVEAFDFVDTLCTGKSGEPFIESAGVLGKGERVFVTAKFPERFNIGGTAFGDEGEMYAVITTSHDGFGAVTVMMTPVRVVCNNTLASAMLHNYSKFSFKHTSQVSNRMRDNLLHASKVLGVYDATLKAINEQTAALARIDVNERMVSEVTAKLAFGDKFNVWLAEGSESKNLSSNLKNTYNGLRKAIEEGVGQDAFKKKDGNWLFNGFTTYFQNYATYGKHGVKDDPTRKFDTLFGGSVYKRLNAAFDNIIKLAA